MTELDRPSDVNAGRLFRKIKFETSFILSLSLDYFTNNEWMEDLKWSFVFSFSKWMTRWGTLLFWKGIAPQVALCTGTNQEYDSLSLQSVISFLLNLSAVSRALKQPSLSHEKAIDFIQLV